jgi:hypothetical protein
MQQFFTKAKKDKGKKSFFDGPIDQEIRDMLLNEYYQNVCLRYLGLTCIVYSVVSEILARMEKYAREVGDLDSEEEW